MIVHDDNFLYHQVADRIGRMIEQGILKSGNKLLSVRALCKEEGISHSTAFMAYSALEQRGLIESRPKSGYYVRYRDRPLPCCQPDAPFAAPRTLEEVIADIYDKMSETGVVQFSIAAPDVRLLPAAKLNKCLVEALRNSPTSGLHYADAAGSESLRRQVARLAFNWGGTPLADDVIVTNGCMEALSLCLQAVTKPGDLVAIESPAYFGIANLLKSLHLRVLEIPVDTATGVDLDFLREAIQRQSVAACLFIPNFNNPVGSLMPDSAKAALVALLAAANIPLIEDDLYGEMYFGPNRPVPCKRYDTNGLVLYCGSFSKTLAPGYRIGWCMPGQYAARVRMLKNTHSISTNTPLQDAVALFCASGRYSTHLRQLRRALHTQCLRYSQAIADYFPEGTRISRPAGGYVLWIELPRHADALELYRRARQHNISIAPGHLFSLSSRYEHFIRIGFGAPFSPEIDRSLRRLGGLVPREGFKPLSGTP